MYTMSNCQSNATFSSTSNRAIIDPSKSQIIFQELMFNGTGMYVLEAEIKSSDDDYDFKCYSYGVMIREPNKTLTIDDSVKPNVIIKFDKDFNTVVANREIEHVKSQFYNCIIDRYGLDLTSSISVYAGSVVASASIATDNAGQILKLSNEIEKIDFGMRIIKASILESDVITEKSDGSDNTGGSSGGSSGGGSSSIAEKAAATAVSLFFQLKF